MPLSEYEQRVLEQLEHDLGSDPKLGHAMSRGQKSRGHLTWAVFGVVAGLGVVLAGVMTQLTLLGIAGFAIMLGFAVWGLTGGKPTSSKAAEPRADDAKGPAPKTATKDHKGFMGRVEDRFERRREEGDL
ncbi:DUF3040 domain-containing protein [Demequina aurantiaca]|uniref:DUF3040 domain-containing protein n=1 Tax=Demequina aurantiaca TaxID=676200 RepID=UPI0007865238|nr:DUF3040 domain-containing protein [Demequina aurantiaca]